MGFNTINNILEEHVNYISRNILLVRDRYKTTVNHFLMFRLNRQTFAASDSRTTEDLGVMMVVVGNKVNNQ